MKTEQFIILKDVLTAFIVLSNKQLRDISAYDRTLVQLFITTLVLIPYCILHGDFVGLQITGGQLALLLILGVVHTGFAYSLYFGSMAYLPATRKFSIVDDKDVEIYNILTTVYQALEEKGYNPINQIVGYILSEDPTYITNHMGARTLIRKLDRDELLQVLVKKYLGQ